MSITMNQLQGRVTAALQRLQSIPHSKHWDRPLLRLQERLENKQKLVAVFGAFSAGKSSLINALVGDNILSVSPNPTTASVSQIQFGAEPVLRITAKTTDQVQSDVNAALVQLHQEPTTELSTVQQMALEMKLSSFTPAQRKYVSFLKSFARGYDDMKDSLGLTWDAQWQDLHHYTADERIAGFIDGVTLAYDTPVLKNGLVLVDTPGVDSIHRRHTDVAFRYIQEADVVIFVLYYTHAFSRADKNFLQQLAGVQDVLGEDKLVVAVNAVDLAASDDEIEAVLSRVRGELRKLGLAAPKVIPVSSQLALAAKQMQRGTATAEIQALVRKRLGLSESETLPESNAVFEQSGFQMLQDSVQNFADEHVYSILTESVRRILIDTVTSISEHVRVLEQRQSATNEERAELKQTREHELAKIQEIAISLEQGDSAAESTASSDWKELGFHAAERIRLKFPQLFREAFYPGRFRQEAKAKQHLQDAAAELARNLSAQLDIESRTLWLRFGTALEKAYTDLQTQIGDMLVNAQTDRSELKNEQYSVKTTDIPTTDTNVSMDEFAPVLRYYKSAKQFFEGGGQANALDRAQELVQPLLHDQIHAFQAQAEDKLRQTFRNEAKQLCERAAESIERILTEDDEGPLDVESELDEYQQVLQAFQSDIKFLESNRVE